MPFAISLAAALFLTSCKKDEGPAATSTVSDPRWFFCYPDKLDEKGEMHKDGECMVTAATCTERSKRWHLEDLCYRQEISFCFIDAKHEPQGATCAGSLNSCMQMRGTRVAGECRARKLDDELARSLGK
jgi:hypothetical protein